MANVSFTRDEVILSLDALYSSTEKHITPKSDTVIQLSALLNQLPIHPLSKRPANFRNCNGVHHQLQRFRQGYLEKENYWNVTSIFFEVDKEFEGRHDELHRIAEAVKRNISYFSEQTFGDITEGNGFPEGALMGHLHRSLELRDSKKLENPSCCQICMIKPENIYLLNCGLIEYHLCTPITKLDWKKHYQPNEFIAVCPNCHAVLHRYRPWMIKDNCTEILR